MDLSFEIEMAKDRDERLARQVVDLRTCKWTTPGGWAENGPGHERNSSLETEDGEVFNLPLDSLKQLMDRLCPGLYRLALRTPSDLIEPVVNHWLTTIVEDKSEVVLKVENNFVWGLLGIEQSDLDDHLVLSGLASALTEYGGGVLDSVPLHLPSADHQNRNSSSNPITPVQFYRVYLQNASFKAGDQEFEPFVDVRFSAFAHGRFEFEFGLNDAVTNTSSLIRVNGKPLFSRNYRQGLDKPELDRVFMLLCGQLQDQIQKQKESLEKAAQEEFTQEYLGELCQQLPHYRDCSERFASRVVSYCVEHPPKNRLSLYNVITLFAVEEAFPSRTKHEAFAGLIAGLSGVGSIDGD